MSDTSVKQWYAVAVIVFDEFGDICRADLIEPILEENPHLAADFELIDTDSQFDTPESLRLAKCLLPIGPFSSGKDMFEWFHQVFLYCSDFPSPRYVVATFRPKEYSPKEWEETGLEAAPALDPKFFVASVNEAFLPKRFH